MVGYCALLLVVLLGPVSVPSDGVGWIGDVAARLGAPDPLLVPSRVEFIVNVAVIAPAAALGSVVWPRTTWRDWTAYGFVFSASIELTQGLLLPTRSARFDDVVANTLGALTGAAFVMLVRWVAARRH
jgi:glycopeptide antibiotics resistance protein